jgi:hypothetical protein
MVMPAAVSWQPDTRRITLSPNRAIYFTNRFFTEPPLPDIILYTTRAISA